MRFSKWHGLGNDYLLVERAELASPLTPEQVRKVCDYHFGVGSDGILEVISANGAEAEVLIWNPDGSTAELSGNGTRIAARWLARRSGEDEVSIRVGPREVRARMRGGHEVEMDVGEVEVGERETIEVGGEAVELTPVSVGNPHAVIRRRAGPRRPAAAWPARREPRALPGAYERPAHARRRPERHLRRRVGAWSGGDAVLGNELGRGGRGRRRERVVREPGDRPPGRRRPPRRAAGRPRASDRARAGDLPGRAGGGIRAVRFSKRLDQVPPYLFAELERKISAKESEGIDVISLGIGDPDLPTPEPVIEAAARAMRDPATHDYPTNHGTQRVPRGRRVLLPRPVRRRPRGRRRDRPRPRREGRRLARRADRPRSRRPLPGARIPATRRTRRGRSSPAPSRTTCRWRRRTASCPISTRSRRTSSRAPTCSSSTTRTTRPARSCARATSNERSSSPAPTTSSSSTTARTRRSASRAIGLRASSRRPVRRRSASRSSPCPRAGT